MQTSQTPPNYWPFPTTPPNLSEKQIRKNEIEIAKQKLENTKRGFIMNSRKFKRMYYRHLQVFCCGRASIDLRTFI